jgi:hypothetical protein
MAKGSNSARSSRPCTARSHARFVMAPIGIWGRRPLCTTRSFTPRTTNRVGCSHTGLHHNGYAIVAPMNAAESEAHALREDPTRASSEMLLTASVASLVAIGIILVSASSGDHPTRSSSKPVDVDARQSDPSGNGVVP